MEHHTLLCAHQGMNLSPSQIALCRGYMNTSSKCSVSRDSTLLIFKIISKAEVKLVDTPFAHGKHIAVTCVASMYLATTRKVLGWVSTQCEACHLICLAFSDGFCYRGIICQLSGQHYQKILFNGSH